MGVRLGRDRLSPRARARWPERGVVPGRPVSRPDCAVVYSGGGRNT